MRVAALTIALLSLGALARASHESAALRVRALQHAYNLDHDLATRDMAAAIKADPQDAAAERGMAIVAWLQLVFQRGAVTVDDYLGVFSKPNVALRAPPPELAALFRAHADRAMQLAEQAVAARPNDAGAHYELGSVAGLQASYRATVDGSLLDAVRVGQRAFDAQERVLAIDPSRKDAGLDVGMYRYIISQLSPLLRVMAYVVGFGGGKERGIHMVEEAASYRSEAQFDAKFALVLLYNRERRYDAAVRLIQELQEAFPRNRLLWLEAGATLLRAGRAAEAEPFINEGLRRLASDARPRMFGEEALWYLKRGTTRLALDRRPAAEADLKRTLSLEARKWVTGRAHAELGKLADLGGDRNAARIAFRRAVALAKEDNDPIGASEAERWINTPYRHARNSTPQPTR